MSLKKFSLSAIWDSVFFKSGIIRSSGAPPRKENKIIPGSKKLSNGDPFSIDNGISINSPFGEIINTPPPPIAPKLRNAN